MQELTPEEQTILKSFRNLKKSRQEAIANSRNAFERWLQEDLPKIWQSIKNFISDLWNGIRDFFFS
jgi:predicted choloylglycine hydrolase